MDKKILIGICILVILISGCVAVRTRDEEYKDYLQSCIEFNPSNTNYCSCWAGCEITFDGRCYDECKYLLEEIEI
tara:strand:- start:153 stop:377 length:225 start_codon:yes stop_codon:yes gene_type:complete